MQSTTANILIDLPSVAVVKPPLKNACMVLVTLVALDTGGCGDIVIGNPLSA